MWIVKYINAYKINIINLNMFSLYIKAKILNLSIKNKILNNLKKIIK
jgi:hypothetical protein